MFIYKNSSCNTNCIEHDFQSYAYSYIARVLTSKNNSFFTNARNFFSIFKSSNFSKNNSVDRYRFMFELNPTIKNLKRFALHTLDTPYSPLGSYILSMLLSTGKFSKKENDSFQQIKIDSFNYLNKIKYKYTDFNYTKTLVSVLVPVYNNSNYIYECISSVLNQSYKNIEIIIINDGSTEAKCISILKYLSEHDHRIKLINKQNTGYGNSMNIGLDAALGEYIAIVESDDFIHREMVKKLVNCINQHSVQFVKCNFSQFIDVAGNRQFCEMKVFNNDEYYNKLLNSWTDHNVFKMHNLNQNGLYRADFIKMNNIRFNETPGASYQDTGFFFQLMCYATNFIAITDSLYFLRRDNPNSSMLSKDKEYCVCDEYDYIHDFLERNNLFKLLFQSAYYEKKFRGYCFTLRRISTAHKDKFLLRFHNEFKEAYNNFLITKSAFSDMQWKRLLLLIRDPQKFYHNFIMPLGAPVYVQKNIKSKSNI